MISNSLYGALDNEVKMRKRKLTKWQVHVKKTSSANKGISFKNILKKAKKSYKR